MALFRYFKKILARKIPTKAVDVPDHSMERYQVGQKLLLWLINIRQDKE